MQWFAEELDLEAIKIWIYGKSQKNISQLFQKHLHGF